MQENYKNIIIFSVYHTNVTEAVNEVNHFKAKTLLKNRGVNFIELDGFYNNVKEKSLLVSHEYRSLVDSLCWEYSQESYLEAHNDRWAELHYYDGRTNRSLGYLRLLTQQEALKLSSYSYNPITKEYWGIIS